MKEKTKNGIVFSGHLIIFLFLTLMTIFIELIWLVEVVFNFDPYDIESYEITVPSAHEIFYSIIIIAYIVLNLTVATFSLYTFIFVLQILNKNPARTTPMCALAIDCSLINLFFFHFSIYKSRYFTYFARNLFLSIFYHIPNLFSQSSEIIMLIAFFTVFINIRFGIEGIYKSRILKTNFITDFIHTLLILNGVLPIFLIYIYIYANFLTITLLGFILSFFISFLIIGVFDFILRKKKLRYPIEAIAIWRHGKVVTKKGKEKA